MAKDSAAGGEVGVSETSGSQEEKEISKQCLVYYLLVFMKQVCSSIKNSARLPKFSNLPRSVYCFALVNMLLVTQTCRKNNNRSHFLSFPLGLKSTFFNIKMSSCMLLL